MFDSFALIVADGCSVLIAVKVIKTIFHLTKEAQMLFGAETGAVIQESGLNEIQVGVNYCLILSLSTSFDFYLFILV